MSDSTVIEVYEPYFEVVVSQPSTVVIETQECVSVTIVKAEGGFAWETIPAGETVIVPNNQQMVLCGDLKLEGDLDLSDGGDVCLL